MQRLLIILGAILLALGLLWPWLQKSGLGPSRRHHRAQGELHLLFSHHHLHSAEPAADAALLALQALSSR